MMKQIIISLCLLWASFQENLPVLHVVYHVKLHVKHVNMIDGIVTRNTTQQQIFIVYTLQIKENE